MSSRKSVVRPHQRVLKGKVYKVRKHNRVIKKRAKRLRYRNVGLFQTAIDDQGRFKGSRVIKLPDKPSTMAGAKRSAIKDLDTKFYNHEISIKEYYERLNDLLTS